MIPFEKGHDICAGDILEFIPSGANHILCCERERLPEEFVSRYFTIIRFPDNIRFFILQADKVFLDDGLHYMIFCRVICDGKTIWIDSHSFSENKTFEINSRFRKVNG